MTAHEKFRLAKGLWAAQMPYDKYAPQIRAWLQQQYNICVNAVVETLETEADRQQFRHIVARDNFLEHDNPFKDDAP